MKNILLTNKYAGAALNLVESTLPQGFAINFLSEQSQDALEEQITDVDYVLAGGRLRITEKVLNNASNLKMIQRSGVGLDSLDLNAIKEKGIPLYVNQGINAESVAEHTLLLMLACLRKLTVINQKTKCGVWKKQEQGIQTTELKGKTVGIIGMGNIAKCLVGLLRPFQVKILYCNPFQMAHEFEFENNMCFVAMEDLLRHSDILTIHCALTNETKNLINEESIGKMKDGSVLINTARGEIVDSQAVAEALHCRKLSFAGLDVHAQEPFSEDYPLKTIENVILTPHIAGITSDSFKAMMNAAFCNIQHFEKGEFEEIEKYRYL